MTRVLTPLNLAINRMSKRVGELREQVGAKEAELFKLSGLAVLFDDDAEVSSIETDTMTGYRRDKLAEVALQLIVLAKARDHAATILAAKIAKAGDNDLHMDDRK